MNRFSSVLIRKVRPNSLRFATSEERIEGLSTNLSILGKSKGNAPITIDCIDLHQHPSADVALFELDPMHSRAQERRFDFYSKLTWTGYSDAHNWNLKNGRNRDETEQDSNND